MTIEATHPKDCQCEYCLGARRAFHCDDVWHQRKIWVGNCPSCNEKRKPRLSNIFIQDLSKGGYKPPPKNISRPQKPTPSRPKKGNRDEWTKPVGYLHIDCVT